MEQTVILLAAGSGKRVGLNHNKLLEKVNDKYVYEYSLDTFLSFNLNVILVVSETDYEFIKNYNKKDIIIVRGGSTRNESVKNALKYVKTKRVLIHDAARALVDSSIIEKCLECKSDAYYVYVPLKDTIRNNTTNQTINRQDFVSCQTPQGGKTSLFNLYEDFSTTDDISSFDNTNLKIEKIEGNDYNFKITTKFDLNLFKMLVKEKL